MATKQAELPKDAVALEYPKAPMSRRMIALLCDTACMLILGLCCFFLLRLGLEQSSWYQEKYNTFVEVSLASHLYYDGEDADVDENGLTTWLEYVEGATDEDGNYLYTTEKQNEVMEEQLTLFYTDEDGLFFSEPQEGDENYATYTDWKARREYYGDTALGYGNYLYYTEKMDARTSDNQPYFNLVGKAYTLTPNSRLSDDTLHDFYVSASDNAAQYLVYNDDYLFATRYLVVVVVFVSVPLSILIPSLVFYFLIPLIFFRRGWQTLGMKPFSLFILNGEAISPRFRTFLARYLWILLVEQLGSLITFGIPLIIAFSMQAFRKDGQSFHDYMSGTYMVDASQQSVYKSKEEYFSLREKFLNSEEKNELLLQPNLRGSGVKAAQTSDKSEGEEK